MRFVRIVTFCGSIRSGSLNRKLLAQAIEVLRPSAEIDAAELRDVPLPIYDGDLETSSGVPDPAKRLAGRIAAADGLVIASPEYNNMIPGGLKNAIDWMSRLKPQPFKGKPVLLLGASPGAYGAVRSQLALRQVITSLFAILVPNGVTLPHADQAFEEDGRLKDPKVRAQIERACAELLRFIAAFPAQRA
ncbi:MAG TPA: NAD(P)H-dependent oxidoreductase [Candidatus Polarisedimenticolia bacterium]|nr:NAD(P)H-dependent oxidoreductase [Candidatus Polarisedimenticolia bacterium]